MYGLRDPETQEIRYVGRTSRLTKRFSERLRTNTTASSHKKAWIQSLLRKGLQPEILVLAECTPEKAVETENFYINQFSNLTNHPGKDGSFGFKYGAVREEMRKTVIGKCLQTGKEVELKGIYSSEHFSGDQISKCLRGEIKSHKGFGWKLKEEVLFSHEREFKRSQGYGVIRVDLAGNELYYEKVTDAVGFQTSGIQRVCNGTTNLHKGYKWRWATQEDRLRFTGKSDKIAFKRNKKRT